MTLPWNEKENNICRLYSFSFSPKYTFNSTCSGTGAAMDIVISSVRAYIGALNKLLGFKNRLEKEDLGESKVLNAYKWSSYVWALYPGQLQ